VASVSAEHCPSTSTLLVDYLLFRALAGPSLADGIRLASSAVAPQAEYLI
jgi:hypothetical protein